MSNIPAIKGVTKANTLKGEYSIDRKTGMLLRAEISGTLTGMTQAEMTYIFTGKEVK